MKLTENMKENIVDTFCDDLIDICRAEREEGYPYMAARMLQKSKEAWEQLEFYKAREWITEEDASHLWDRMETVLEEWMEDWENGTIDEDAFD